MNTNLLVIFTALLTGPIHFKDCVVVSKGFYEGCQGTVDEEWSGTPTEYTVSLNCKKESIRARFTADQLVKCTK